MIAAAGIPPGQPGSLFKIPCADGLSSLTASKSSFDFLGTAVTATDATFDSVFYIDHMDTAINLVNDHLVAKVADTPAQLSACVAASSVAKRAQTIDSAVTGSDYPNVVNNAFPSRTVSSDSSVTGAFVTIAESPAQVNLCVTGVNTSFDTTGSAMMPVYSAITGAGGPPISNGTQLLAYMGGASPSVQSAVTAVIDTDAGVVNAIKTAFAFADNAFLTLTDSFNETKVRETAAYAFAMAQLKGSADVAMLNSKSPDVAAVLGQCVDYAQVSSAALAVAQKLYTAPIPGNSAVTAVKVDRPIKEETAPAVSPIPGPDVKYSDSEIGVMSTGIAHQEEVISGNQRELGSWMQANIEAWKPTVDYNSKRTAAGWDPDHPDGTTTSDYIKSQWIVVRDECAMRMEYYNSTLLPKYNNSLMILKQMKAERERRMYFGRNPYTFLASRGEPVPENEQTVYFDTSK